MLLSNCAVCGKKKWTFINNEELHNFNNIWNDQFKINKIFNKFLLTGDKFMPDLGHCGPFPKHCEIIQKIRETGNLKHLYRNELEKACLAHHTVYIDSKDLVKRTICNC